MIKSYLSERGQIRSGRQQKVKHTQTLIISFWNHFKLEVPSLYINFRINFLPLRYKNGIYAGKCGKKGLYIYIYT